MPRVSRAEADSHREAITEASARLFKERGLKAVSVADLMGAAGLTHGGFYGHFESKDALAGIAAEHAFEQSAQRWRKRIAAQPDAAARRAAIVEPYLTQKSLRDVGIGCPTVALASDVAREPADAPIRAAYIDGLGALVDILATVQQAGDPAADRRAALADYATMAGAMLLARAAGGSPLSDEILVAARERLMPAPVASTPAPPVRRPSQEA
jgi:TetR/AcrR family transcriptional repressor of nem operon